jgi:hypothetical protein
MSWISLGYKDRRSKGIGGRDERSKRRERRRKVRFKLLFHFIISIDTEFALITTGTHTYTPDPLIPHTTARLD